MKLFAALPFLAAAALAPALARADEPYPELPPASDPPSSPPPKLRTHMRDKALFVSGLVLSIAGTGVVAGGAVLVRDAPGGSFSTGLSNSLTGLVMIFFGAPGILAGIPMAVVGSLPSQDRSFAAVPAVRAGPRAASLSWTF